MAELPDGNASGYEELLARAETALRLNSESPAVEFKAGASWTTLKIDIIKTVMAMCNLRDGGLIIVGRPPDNTISEGVSTADLETFDPDVMRDQIDKYASPRALVTIVRVSIEGSRYVLVDVAEFEEDMVICKKALDPDLKAGAVYIRPFTGRPRTTQVKNAEEMRSVVNLAIDKGRVSFETTAQRRGYVPSPTTANKYQDEIKDLDDA